MSLLPDFHQEVQLGKAAPSILHDQYGIEEGTRPQCGIGVSRRNDRGLHVVAKLRKHLPDAAHIVDLRRVQDRSAEIEGLLDIFGEALQAEEKEGTHHVRPSDDGTHLEAVIEPPGGNGEPPGHLVVGNSRQSG